MPEMERRQSLETLLSGSDLITPEEVTEYIPMMVRTIWHQGTPFDLHTPIRRGLRPSSRIGRSPAGCAPVALAQLLTQVAVAHGSRNPLFRSLERVSALDPRVTSTASEREMAGRFLSEIGTALSTIYTTDFGLTWPWRIRLLLTRMGFHQARLHWWGLREAIERSLRNGLPVILTAGREDLTFHTWIVDGLLRTEDALYLHCNYGWGGRANGYYRYGRYDVSRGPLFRSPEEQRLPRTSSGRYHLLPSVITL